MASSRRLVWRPIGPHLELAAPPAGISAANRMRGISWFASGCTSWKGTGLPRSSQSQRAPQSSKSR